MSELITAQLLKEKGADNFTVGVFAVGWPQGFEVTRANLEEAAFLHIDMHWFAMHFLPVTQQMEYIRQEENIRVETGHREARLVWKLWEKKA